MISCTEFIPLYSEFFKYLEAQNGPDAVMEYWYHISDNSIGDKTNPHSLASFIERSDDPFEGAVNYWRHTLTEEACDLFCVIDHEKKQRYSHMRHCPSRGMLNALEHVEPYHNYCEHCNVIYQRVLDNYGVQMDMDFSKIDNAECGGYLYMKGHPPTEDCHIPDDTKEIIDMKPEDNKYLHRDFHLLGDMALTYCGDNFGDDAVIGFLTTYVKNYYSPQIEDIKKRGLLAIKEWIEDVYEREEATDLLHTELSDNTLTVTIDKSPVIEYMHSLNQEPGRFYDQQTKTLYAVVAESAGFGFELAYYNEDGGTKFTFTA